MTPDLALLLAKFAGLAWAFCWFVWLAWELRDERRREQAAIQKRQELEQLLRWDARDRMARR